MRDMMPALHAQVIVFANQVVISAPLQPITRWVRLHATDDCLISFQPDEATILACPLAAGETEWFEIAKNPPKLRISVKAEPDDE